LDFPDILCAFDRRYVGDPVHEEDGGGSFRARVGWIRLGMTKDQIKALDLLGPWLTDLIHVEFL
jgi:hypothetical protein